MKTINKTMTQEEIYKIASNFMSYFNDNESKMPVAIAYAIQKNKQALVTIAQEIEQNRHIILTRYGTLQEDGNFFVPQEAIAEANLELQKLLQIQEEVKLYILTLEELQSVELTMSQMNTLMFMIDEDSGVTTSI